VELVQAPPEVVKAFAAMASQSLWCTGAQWWMGCIASMT